MHILIVDDEDLARRRLRTLLAECDGAFQVHEAAHADAAMQRLTAAHEPAIDLVLLDIQMPGRDGLALAQHMGQLAHPPAIVFVTAHAEHALSAFELDALDYLTKPVRRQRLQQALAKVQRLLQAQATGAPAATALEPAPEQAAVVASTQGRVERIPLAEVLYLRAEQKYLTLRTAARSHVIDGALADFEARFPAHFVRIHRSTLAARHAVRALLRTPGGAEGETWCVRLQGIAEPLPVSRRQLAAVREVLQGS